MITYSAGDLLRDPADALVNTVNCVGVMGKGLALQFRRAFPDGYESYRIACATGEVRPGRMHVHDRGEGLRPRWIINFPTKRHWRQPSRLEDITAGLTDLVAVIRRLGVSSIAVPPLGCGNGGLDWAEVGPLLDAALSPLINVSVRIYPPVGAPPPEEMINRSRPPALTRERARVLCLIAGYVRRAAPYRAGDLTSGASRVEIQKLAYFADQLLGWPALSFQPAVYGPYAHQLDIELRDWEGHYTLGYGDGTGRVRDLRPIRVLPPAEDSADAMLAEDPPARAVVQRVLALVEGWEQPDELELLATVHWLAARDGVGSPDDATRRIRSWNARKSRLFGSAQVADAWEHLNTLGWLPADEADEHGS